MKLRVFTLPFDLDLGRFDDEMVQHFLSDKELLSAHDHFFTHLGLPHLAVVLTYGAGGAPKRAVSTTKRKPGKDDWRALLEPGDMPLFNSLREWRGTKAKEEGIPPYVICTNRQLAEVVRRRPQSLNKLAEIEGFGTAKLKRYGSDMLGFLTSAGSAANGPQPKTVPEEPGDDG